MRVESSSTPPASFVTRLTDFVQSNQPANCTVELRWDTIPSDDPEPSTQDQGRADKFSRYIFSLHIPVSIVFGETALRWYWWNLKLAI